MQRKGFSLLKTTVGMVVVLSLGAMATHTVMSWLPRNLSKVEGGGPLEEGVAIPDLHARLKESLANNYEVVITESELNHYLRSKLVLTQSPIIDDYVKITGVYVDLQPNVIDVSIERQIDLPDNVQPDGSKKVSFMPFSQTVSMQLEVRTERNAASEYIKSVRCSGGQFGEAPAPGGLVYVVKPSFDTIAEFFKEEIEMAYLDMASITVEDGLIRLDPRAVVIPRKEQ